MTYTLTNKIRLENEKPPVLRNKRGYGERNEIYLLNKKKNVINETIIFSFMRKSKLDLQSHK